MKRELSDGICKVCGISFTPKLPWQLTCTPEHGTAWRNRNKVKEVGHAVMESRLDRLSPGTRFAVPADTALRSRGLSRWAVVVGPGAEGGVLVSLPEDKRRGPPEEWSGRVNVRVML